MGIVTLISQILIIEFGGIAFSTTPLNVEQWTWCIFFGVGVLLWQQIVTSVPTSIFGKTMETEPTPSLKLENNNLDMRVGTNPPEPLSPVLDGDVSSYSHHGGHGQHHNPIVNRSGQILWIRGLTRLQTQLRVIRAFKSTLEDMEEKRSCHSMHSVRSTRSYLTRPTSDISYIDDDEKWKAKGSGVSSNGHYIRAQHDSSS